MEINYFPSKYLIFRSRKLISLFRGKGKGAIFSAHDHSCFCSFFNKEGNNHIEINKLYP